MIVVFAGPTLSNFARDSRPDLTWRGPAAQGDVYRAVLDGATTIGVIDGYFETVPSVWHKEILYAISKGVRVFGAASMGALRAAELARYGMVGIGEIYEAFARGDLDDDDEVAILHGSSEDNYRPLSEAMVNIRATLAKAQKENVLDEATHSQLLCIAKTTFYQQRSFQQLVHEGTHIHGVESLARWLPNNKVDQKRIDGLALLVCITDTQQDTSTQRRSWVFEHTDAWEAMRRSKRDVSIEPA
jgi:hypothetical protein